MTKNVRAPRAQGDTAQGVGRISPRGRGTGPTLLGRFDELKVTSRSTWCVETAVRARVREKDKDERL